VNARKMTLIVGGLVTAATLTAATGVADAATTSHPKAAQHRLSRLVKRETTAPDRFDKAAGRLDTRSTTLTTKVDALAQGPAKSDALASLADLATKTAAVRANDATVLASLKTVDTSNVAATTATLKADKTTLLTTRKDIRAARKDARSVLRDLRKG
jgi:hypothetical protein